MGVTTWKRFLAIDPGGVHCGTALFWEDECVWAREFTPSELFSFMETMDVCGVVSEEYRLYPWMAKQQSFSQLEVVQTIGALKYICTRRGIPLVEQSAQIKVPIAAQLQKREVKFKSWGHGGHARDAELHGYYYIHSRKQKGKR